MPLYVVLYNLTEQGIRDIRATVQRAKDGQAESEELGFKMHHILWTQGPYDVVAIIEAPDEQAMMAGLMNIAEAGNARSLTMRAFTADEMDQAIRRMG